MIRFGRMSRLPYATELSTSVVVIVLKENEFGSVNFDKVFADAFVSLQALLYFQRALKLDSHFLSAWTLMGHEYVEIQNCAAAIGENLNSHPDFSLLQRPICLPKVQFPVMH